MTRGTGGHSWAGAGWENDGPSDQWRPVVTRAPTVTAMFIIWPPITAQIRSEIGGQVRGQGDCKLVLHLRIIQ